MSKKAVAAVVDSDSDSSSEDVKSVQGVCRLCVEVVAQLAPHPTVALDCARIRGDWKEERAVLLKADNLHKVPQCIGRSGNVSLATQLW